MQALRIGELVKENLKIPPNYLLWENTWGPEFAELDPRHPSVGVLFTLDKSDLRSAGRYETFDRRYLPIMEVPFNTANPPILRHLTINFGSLKFSRYPTPEAPIRIVLMSQTVGKYPVTIREINLQNLSPVSGFVYPGASSTTLVSGVPFPLADLVLEPGTQLELQMDNAVFDFKLEVLIYLSNVE